MKWRLAVPPRVVDAMDEAQKWAIACTREALEDYGFPKRPLDTNRTAVILGNAMAGEKHYLTSLRVHFPEYEHELAESTSFASLPEAVRRDITRELHQRITKRLPEITEDSMPGELANCIAGRIANIFNFHGPNFIADAACASAMAAISGAVEGLVERNFDVAITGGIDRNMGAPTFVKFCKIGALSATGTRPYAEGADGFVMGEGAAIFLLKRLADAERDGDKIYAVLRGIGGSSDGKGKGITAPNPVGQKLAIQRAWENAGLSPASATLMEGHGTSTSVGDVVEVESMAEVLGSFHLPASDVALGSVKSNIGHLKGAAGAAGLLKTALALRDKVLPPSIHCEHPNPNIDFARCPLYVNRELQPWTAVKEGARRAGVSAFGFGGTNFHLVMEEYIPHCLTGNGKRTVLVGEVQGIDTTNGKPQVSEAAAKGQPSASLKAPLRGALVIGGSSEAAIVERLTAVQKFGDAGQAPAPAPPAEFDLRATERIAIDYADAADLAEKAGKALKALSTNQPAVWKPLRAQGIFRGHGPAPKVAFLYTGQGSQYANMLAALRSTEPIVAQTFEEADRIMTPLLGKTLSDFVFVDAANPSAVAKAEEDLRQTAITQPAVLAADLSLTRLMAAYGIEPDMTMGHSLGEYGALVASGALPFEDALEAVSARGREMTRVSMADNGRMAAVFAPLPEIERILKTSQGYVVIANINSNTQAVIGGATQAVEQTMKAFLEAGYNAVALPVSHAFHTSIVAPASGPLRQTLERLHLESPRIPIVANVSGEFYPTGPYVVPEMLDILAKQVAAPVQFVQGLRTLYNAGARVFVEVGPKKALQGFAEDVLGEHADTLTLFTNHPKTGDIAAFNQALCGLYASGLGAGQPAQREHVPRRSRPAEEIAPVVITGAALGLPGTDRIFDDSNVGAILRGEQFIDVIPTRHRRAMLDKHITRLVKSDKGEPTFETLTNPSEVIKLAGRGKAFDLQHEFGVSAERLAGLDRVTQLAMAVGLEALRDAGIPLVMRYKTTSKGTQLPERWGLPDTLRDRTGVIFASAFPGYDSFAQELTRYHTDRARREQLSMLEGLRSRLADSNGHSTLLHEIDLQVEELRTVMAREPYVFNRRFLFRTLPMGHSQFAEFIGARGPNTQLNAACASTTQGVAVAEDWIRAGRCNRVIIISADDVTTDNLLEWVGAGFLASGAAATDDVVEEAALPFDRRRHGMIMGMGAAALVVESEDAAIERGIQPICEVLSTATANSAYHGTRLDVEHISGVMEKLVAQAEQQHGIDRRQIAPNTVFISHETYTPARGGSASAEIHALRGVFGEAADQIVITNTKGFTGHAIGAGMEDVVAVKALETGCVPPVANFKEVDPELGVLNLSKGGFHPVEYALRLGAGFGSQISLTLTRRTPAATAATRPGPNSLGYAYRIADPVRWNSWITSIAGKPAAELEVVHRTLRVRDGAHQVQQVEPPGKAMKPPAPPAKIVPPSPKPDTRTSVTPKPAASAPASTPPPKAVPQTDPVKERILALVAERTGYPSDILDPDLDLEADLGVDTVKQADLFAVIRETYGIPRDDKVKLRDFPTLAHVVRFVHERRPDLAVAGPPPDLRPEPAPVVIANAGPSVASAPIPKTTTGDPGADRILDWVADKTGYPRDMLEVDLDLEADLGVDTVKQADMFAAVREMYNIPRDANLKLRDFPTLAHVIRFVHERRPDLAAPEPPPVQALVPPSAPEHVPSAAGSNSGNADPVAARILDWVADKTGYPRDMLEVDLDLEADLGVDTVKQADMFAAVREMYNIPRDANLKLRDFPTLAHVIRFVHERRPDLKIVEAPMEIAVSAVNGHAAAAAVVAAPEGPSTDPVMETLLDMVAEKTGYPRDMLDPDLDLEADLGVDTVKQADLFASVRAAYHIPRDQNLKLRDFPTLAHVARFVHERLPAAGAPSTAAEDAPVKPAPASMDAVQTVPRRVPVPVLRPPLSICKSTGVTLGAGSRVVVMPDKGGVAEALEQRLGDSGVQVLRLDPTGGPDSLEAMLKQWTADGPVHGVYWLPALDSEGSLADMDLAGWRAALGIRVKSLYTTMRTLYELIAARTTFLISATRLGGQHGYDEAGAFAPMGGAVAGFTKTYKRERGEALVKTVDFEAQLGAREIAAALLDETTRDPGAVEIGYKNGLRWTVGLQEQPAANGQPGMTLDNRTVFVITGAAGSIVSAITADLAAASGGIFYLLDLAPPPDPANPDLKRFSTDKEGLMRDIHARLKAHGKRPTPALIEKEMAVLERVQAAQGAIDAVRAAGGTAHYFSVNLTDASAVTQAITQVRERSGRVDVLLHAAGLERSRFLPDKDPREFDLVFDVKSDGWFNVLHAIGGMPLGAVVVFSSIAGRFGNGGQADYSSANDLLCKITSNFRTTRPATRGIAIDWTAWGGIGMATRGSIPKMMEQAGIDMLPPEAGIPFIRHELTAGGARGEVIVAQGLGILQNEWDETGGLDTASLRLKGDNGFPAFGPMIGNIRRIGLHSGLIVETTLDPATQPFLHDHQIDGKPVLPGVMGIEAFAEAAQWMLPDWHVGALEDVSFLAPLKFYHSEPRTVTIQAFFYARADGVIADCRLTASRSLPGQEHPQTTTHFTARVRMVREAPEAPAADAPDKPEQTVVEASDIYRVFFHGPAYQVVQRAWRRGARFIGQMASALPANHMPAEQPTVIAPRVVELCFQTAALEGLAAQGSMGLPAHINEVSTWRTPDLANATLFAIATPDDGEGGFEADVVDQKGNRYMRLKGYRMIAHPDGVDAKPLAALSAVGV
ncbi:MAG: SDR family NAD(P)-dependent oxidoreductase [Bryobacteraceae bacterium]